MGCFRFLVALLLLVVTAAVARAQPATLTLADGGGRVLHAYTAEQLLADPAARDVTIAPDPNYGRPMTYRALPMVRLITDLKVGPDDYVQVRSSDGFSVSIPARLLLSQATDKPMAFLAVEVPGRPWPMLPIENRTTGPGPFYIVWRGAARGGVSSEYWPFWVTSISAAENPTRRWPRLAVGPEVPAFDPIRRGLDRFVAVCMACHRFDGEGEANLGPDLARPMSPVHYFQPAAFRRFLRDPGALRTWPNRVMPAFSPADLPDADIDAIIAWLNYKAKQP